MLNIWTVTALLNASAPTECRAETHACPKDTLHDRNGVVRRAINLKQ